MGSIRRETDMLECITKRFIKERYDITVGRRGKEHDVGLVAREIDEVNTTMQYCKNEGLGQINASYAYLLLYIEQNTVMYRNCGLDEKSIAEYIYDDVFCNLNNSIMLSELRYRVALQGFKEWPNWIDKKYSIPLPECDYVENISTWCDVLDGGRSHLRLDNILDWDCHVRFYAKYWSCGRSSYCFIRLIDDDIYQLVNCPGGVVSVINADEYKKFLRKLEKTRIGFLFTPPFRGSDGSYLHIENKDLDWKDGCRSMKRNKRFDCLTEEYFGVVLH